MTHKQALQMRMAINVLIRLTDPDRYGVAIKERLFANGTTSAEFEIHLFVKVPPKSGFINLALLAHAIEEMGIDFVAVESTYDAGIKKGEDIRQSVKIW